MNPILATISGAISIVRSIAQSLFSGLFGSAQATSQSQRKDFSIEVVRPDDLLVLRLDFYNVAFTAAAGAMPAQLSRRGVGDAFMVVLFPPQSFAEQAFFELDPHDPVTGPPVISRIAGASQVVVRLAASSLPLDVTLESLLGVLAQSDQVIQRAIQEPGPECALGQIANFGGLRGLFTAIEAPYRLVLSPSASSRWQHAVAAVRDKSGKRTELWHTRLSPGAMARAVWSPDVEALENPPSLAETPFRAALRRRDRHEIVHSTANRSLIGNAALAIDRMMLSSQGAWLDLHGNWATTLDLVEWRHILTGGRDQFARIVTEGRLFIFGHKAICIEITERKLRMVKAGELEGKPAAYLLKTLYVALREPTKVYSHRHLPFRTVTIKTPVTPALMPPKDSELFAGADKSAFWPQVPVEGGGAQDFLFHIVATDWEGHEIELRAPLAFIAKSVADEDAVRMSQIVADFETLAETDGRRSRPMGGQKIAFAPSDQPGDTTHETSEMILGAIDATGLPLFLPTMAKAKVDVPAVRQLTGKAAPSTIEFDADFLKFTGKDIGNMGAVYALLPKSEPSTPVKFPPEKTGGLVAPDFGISGFSRSYGPVGDASKFADGKFNAKDVFKGVKLLGCIDLAGIISDLINVTPDSAGAMVPGLKTIRTNKPGLGEVFETSYGWSLPADKLIDQLSLDTKGPFQPNKPNDKAFSIETVVDTPIGEKPLPPVFTVTGKLSDFSLTLIPVPSELSVVKLHFDSITFTAGSDTKVDVNVIFKKFEFTGPLAFVNKLQEFIPLDGFQDPPYLDLVLPPKDKPGVNVGFTLGIPTIGIGIFVLQNISFSAGFYLPLLGDSANLRLAFCERHQPFLLTVSLFGGGGFFAIDIGLDQVVQIEAALEFGAATALNLGVACGSVSIMGGVYYQMALGGPAFSAYLRANGSLSVLGIVTVSVEFYLALNYQSDKNAAEHGGKLWGQASLKVKVKIAFFSKSVSISLEREFAGSDPTFALTMPKLEDWQTYCAAFADYPA